jgi:ATP-dependent Clp protease ATP-binding subunit ClpA
MRNMLLAFLSFSFLGLASQAQDRTPDLDQLKDSGFIMGPGNTQYPVHSGWRKYTDVMQLVSTFDNIVQEIEPLICGPELNKSVLIIGEPDVFFKYVFARLATRPNSPCAGMWHVEIDINKIEAGHRFVGDVDQYWRESILEPSENKNVVLYLDSLGGLIGLGSHSNDDTGIEREYSSNIASGKIRSVAFMDKFDYNQTIRSKHGYVLNSFAKKVVLPPVQMLQAAELIRVYMAALFPHLKLEAAELNYLLKTAEFYMPNTLEPERSLQIINKLAREAGDVARDTKSNAVTIETAHPYTPNTVLNWTVEYPGAQELQLSFDSFDLETNYDTLTIKNAQGVVLETLTGNKGSFRTRFYPGEKLFLEFRADNSGSNAGFKISTVVSAKLKTHTFTLAEVRKAVMTVAQVPEWLISRDYTVIKNLQGLLDSDVVGVAEGKADLVRLAKNGYVAGRTDDKPIATILFAGPTGTGKSYIAKKMAEFTGQQLITMDMTSYKEPSSFKIFQEFLARSLINSPYAIYLFEEIDKASIEVLDQLYFMMDEGIFYDAYQRPLFSRGAFMILTTNAASDTILANPKSPELRKLVMADLQKSFRMSFLNRFDAISIFVPFSNDEYRQLAMTLANKKIAKIKEFYNWTMTVDAGTYEYISVNGRSAVFGARPMERLTETVLGSGIAEYQLEHGVVPDEAKLEITKLAATNAFRLKVNNKSIEYTVAPMDPSNFHPGELKVLRQLPLSKFFESIRIYED